MFRISRTVRAFSTSHRLRALKPFLLADVGEGIRECEVIQWMIQPGARLEEFDPVCELQSDKATVEITSRFSGVVKKLHYEVGDMALVGQPLLDMEVPDEPGDEPNVSIEPTSNASESNGQNTSQSANQSASQSASEPASQPSELAKAPVEQESSARQDFLKALATPAVRRLCRENSIDITSVNGTGKCGRVLKEDVLHYLAAPGADSATMAPASATSTAPVSATITPLKGVAKQMFTAMSASVQIPHFLFTEEIYMDNLMALRKRVNAKAPLRLSYMPFMIKALSMSIKEYPVVNARYVDDPEKGPSIEHRPMHNISIAMDTPQGLVVPVIKNVECKTIMEIAAELARLQEAGSSGKLASGDLHGGTISLSNIGVVGGTYVGPVLVSSQVAIGGIGAIKRRPEFDSDDKVVAKNVMMTSWSGDHRILDGVTLAKMVMRWKHYLEFPDEMLVDLV